MGATNSGRYPKGGSKKDERKKAVTPDELKKMRKLIKKEIPAKERVALLAKLARGVEVEKLLKDGTKTTLKEAPDRESLKLLEEYATGKPSQTVELGTKDNQPFPIVLIPD